ncbi:MAG TPA: beta-galactosidase GalA [Vicinamibacterales bacterium]|nr:beta-galactosidase GalA [Vicinamibacterales bacterium]
MKRRDLLKLAALAGGSTLLPEWTGVKAAAQDIHQRAQAEDPADVAGSKDQAYGARERLLADFGWQFHLGHADDPAQDFGYGGRGAAFAKSGELFQPARVDFDAAGWQAADLPHDWAVDLPFVDERDLIEHGAKPLGRRHPATSIGWYRRMFTIPASDNGRRIALEFDGVFRDCIVALNGHYIGRNLSGYAPFRFDVTDFVTYGGPNALAVRVDATEYEGWFYEGAGIYRHVWLEKTSPLHVGHWGTFVTSEVSGESATLTIRTDVVNESGAPAGGRLTSRLLDPDGSVVATVASGVDPIAPWTLRPIVQQATVAHPRLWSIEAPHVYRLETVVEDAGSREVDRVRTPFGIRTVQFDPDRGLLLNGQFVKIKGMCNHQDHAGVGSALPDRLQSFRIERLKAMGVNAYRTSHNPPTAALLDACDRLGMLVLDETRMMSSSDEGLSQFSRMIRRDRHHPSVFCWSIGNEEPDQGTDRGARIAATMKRMARDLDPSRLVTEAMNGSWGKGLSAVVDVQGFNYGHAPQLDAFHAQFPRQPSMGTEVASTVSTRGIYENDEVRGYVSAYDVNFPRWASTAEEWWRTYDARAWLAGGFVWTGFDYRGEPTPYGWPCISSHFGIMDTCGFPKDLFFYYQAWWTDQPVLHLFPHWNWSGHEGQPIDVWGFTNLDRVELFVNGRSAGAQEVERDAHVAWKVPYAAGAIEARGFKAGRQVLVSRRETTGPAAAIVLQPDRDRLDANAEDVAVVTARIVDAQGREVPIASNDVSFRVSGPGRLIGVGNGDPSSHEEDHANHRHAFNGLCMALVQTTREAGSITVEASSPSLQPAVATIVAVAATGRPRLI